MAENWFFMFFMVLLCPLSMIVIGKRAKDYQPKASFDMSKYRRKVKIRGQEEWMYLSGYRTGRSMKNDQTFRFAQKLFGECWYKLGLIILFPTIFAMLLLIHQNKDTIGWLGMLIVFVQLLFLVSPYLVIERELKRHFDQEGNRIE